MNSSNSSMGKSLPISSPPSVPSGAPPTPNFESSRRPAQPASSNHYAPRKGQGQRKQHKNQRRPGFPERANSNLDVDDTMAELRAVRNPSSRRGQTSITHLLSYSTPRPFQDHGSYARSYRRNPTWGPGSGYHAADKARYVHANYRFVVSPETTYSGQARDADLHLDWTNVMQIIASSQSQSASCPICLSDPVAPRMAQCGHIFCLPCLIRFMNSSSNEDGSRSNRGARWKKCPICEDSVYLHEVRPVRFYAGQESPLPRVGDDVILRLMARHTNSTLALPRESGGEELNRGDDVPWHYAAGVLDYARIMKGTSDYMAAQFDEEVAALMQQEMEDGNMFDEGDEWTQKAIRAVNAAKEKAIAMAIGPSTDQRLVSNAAKSTAEADFYFYGTPPHLYLSPLDIRILKTKYGAFSSFPSTLLPQVEHISTGHVVDEAMRKRAKYLGHLPHGCIISFLECDWTDVVPSEVLYSFTDEIEKRRRRNRDKALQEERERQQSERLEAAALRGVLGTRRVPDPYEDDHAPRMDLSEFQPLATPAGTTPPDSRPGFEALADMSTSPSAQRTVWGTHVRAASPLLEAVRPLNLDDGWLKDEDLLGTDELAMQIEAIEAMEHDQPGPSNDHGDAGGAAKSSGSKKKKKQKITLMSTGGRRGN